MNNQHIKFGNKNSEPPDMIDDQQHQNIQVNSISSKTNNKNMRQRIKNKSNVSALITGSTNTTKKKRKENTSKNSISSKTNNKNIKQIRNKSNFSALITGSTNTTKKRRKENTSEKLNIIKFTCCKESVKTSVKEQNKINIRKRDHVYRKHCVYQRFICLICLTKTKCIFQSNQSSAVAEHIINSHMNCEGLDLNKSLESITDQFLLDYNIIKKKEREKNVIKYNISTAYNISLNQLNEFKEFINLFKSKLNINLKQTNFEFEQPKLINIIKELTIVDKLIGNQDQLVFNNENTLFNLIYSSELNFKTSGAVIQLIKEYNDNQLNYDKSIFNFVLTEFKRLNQLEGIRNDDTGVLYAIINMDKLNINNLNLVSYIKSIEYFGKDECRKTSDTVKSCRQSMYNKWLSKNLFRFTFINNLNNNYKEMGEATCISSIQNNLKNEFSGQGYRIYGWLPSTVTFLGAALIYSSYLKFIELKKELVGGYVKNEDDLREPLSSEKNELLCEMLMDAIDIGSLVNKIKLDFTQINVDASIEELAAGRLLINKMKLSVKKLVNECSNLDQLDDILEEDESEEGLTKKVLDYIDHTSQPLTAVAG